MFEIPTTLNIGGVDYNIRERGDFRMVLDCFSALNDVELTKQERILSCLVIFYETMCDIEDIYKFSDIEEATKQMFWFFSCGQADADIQSSKSYKLIDWEKDQQMISSGINKVYGGEIREVPYCHWWTFMGYYGAIGESTLSTVVGIRQKIATNTKLEKYEKDFKRDNPQYFTWNPAQSLEEKEIETNLRKMWESG